MPLREPSPPLRLSFSMAMAPQSASSSPSKDASTASTILDQCLQLPKLNLGSRSARSSASRPKFLDLIEPLRHPFTTRPAWCLQLETHTRPRAVTLLDVYKNHEFLTTVRFVLLACWLLVCWHYGGGMRGSRKLCTYLLIVCVFVCCVTL